MRPRWGRSEGDDRSHASCGRTNLHLGLSCGPFLCHRIVLALLVVQGVRNWRMACAKVCVLGQLEAR